MQEPFAAAAKGFHEAARTIGFLNASPKLRPRASWTAPSPRGSMTGRERDVVRVTGSGGLIGRPLVERLADRLRVVGLDHEGSDRHPRRVAECLCTGRRTVG